jgi:hypothetical protein
LGTNTYGTINIYIKNKIKQIAEHINSRLKLTPSNSFVTSTTFSQLSSCTNGSATVLLFSYFLISVDDIIC